MIRVLCRFTFAGLLLACAALAGCNLTDELADKGPPSAGCEDDGDCNDHGSCEIVGGEGTCECLRGYRGTTCDRCATGYEAAPGGLCLLPVEPNNMTNNNTTNNVTTGPECEDGEVLLGEECVVDGCANDPCGDGTCTVTGDNVWECECPNGSTGIECPSCAGGCVNGTCDVDGQCVCEQGWAGTSCNACAPGWAGAACDMCAPNAFGPNCDTCASLAMTEAWWDTAYQARQLLIVYNPQASQILDGAITRHSANHAQLVNMGADRSGGDIRVVYAGSEIDRLLGFDSGWNLVNTEIWFATQAALEPNAFQAYYVYARNTMAPAALDSSRAVLRQDRGWYFQSGGPLYSASPLSTGQYSIQLRQKDPMTLQIYFHDSGDEPTAAALVRFINTTTGAEINSVSFGSGLGSSVNPADEFQEVTGLPASVRLDVVMSPGDLGTNTAALYLGTQLANSGTQTFSYQATLQRANNFPTSPGLFVCAPETQ